MATPLLSIEGVSKSFGGIAALRDVRLTVNRAECIALVGENGAGKSTLMKVLSGVWPHGSYEGEVVFEGNPLRLFSPLDGRKSGISIIHQELCLFPKLTVAENLFLTDGYPYKGTPSQNLFEGVRWDSMYSAAQALFKELGFDINARAAVEDLSVAQRQLVEIARAFHHRAKLLILDEPTSALSQKEVKHLFEVIFRMRKAAMSFIYISHKLDEVFTLADRIVVLRDGQTVKELLPANTDDKEVIRHMVGRPLKVTARAKSKQFDTALFEVDNLSHIHPSGKRLLNEISFSIAPGEVLGIAGLMGSGRSELLRSILGILPGERTGAIKFNGEVVQWEGIQSAMACGVAFVPEDRKKDGLFLDHGIDFNISISVLDKLRGATGMLDLVREEKQVAELTRRLGVKCSDPKAPVKSLSGGNQQKVLLGKVVALSPRVLMLDEPTRGIDVGAKEEIYDIIRSLAASGISVILVSSELPEILSLSDRILVLREGSAVGELHNQDLDQEQVMAFAAGGRGAEGDKYEHNRIS